MSAFASFVTQTVPFDDGTSALIRKLNHRKLREAARAFQQDSIENVRRMGGAVFMAELQAMRDAAEKQAAEKAAGTVAADAPEPAKPVVDPMNGYDPDVLMASGIVSWTFTDPDGAPVPVSQATIEDLDDDKADALARAVLKLAKPSLFLTPDEAEADRVKG